MHVHCAFRSSDRPEGGGGLLEAELQVDEGLLLWMLAMNTLPLQEQEDLLSTEPSFAFTFLRHRLLLNLLLADLVARVAAQWTPGIPVSASSALWLWLCLSSPSFVHDFGCFYLGLMNVYWSFYVLNLLTGPELTITEMILNAMLVCGST